MFRVSETPQNTTEWLLERLGKPSGSVLDRIVTSTGKLSSSRDDLVNRAVAELILEVPDETFQSDSMLRGKLLEDDALEFFNFTNDFEFKKVGFVEKLDENGEPMGYGFSPDALWGKMFLELKVPEPHTHLAYLSLNDVPKTYFQQTQMPFLVGMESGIFGSFHPNLPCVCVKVNPDEKWLKLAEPLVLETVQMIKEKFEELSKKVRAS